MMEEEVAEWRKRKDGEEEGREKKNGKEENNIVIKDKTEDLWIKIINKIKH